MYAKCVKFAVLEADTYIYYNEVVQLFLFPLKSFLANVYFVKNIIYLLLPIPYKNRSAQICFEIYI